jgi:hypothetical protein
MASATSENIVTRLRRSVIEATGTAKPSSSIRLSVENWKELDDAGKRYGGLSRGETVELLLALDEKRN